jgi:hypothetical protein
MGAVILTFRSFDFAAPSCCRVLLELENLSQEQGGLKMKPLDTRISASRDT